MNIVLFTLDCVRKDRLGCYGHPDGLTPNIDKVAERGVKFTQAVTAANFTDPSHASLLTSTWPTKHGVYWNAVRLKENGPVTIAEELGRHGFETAAAVSVEHLSSFFGLDRGFDVYYNSSPFDAIFHYSTRYRIGKWRLSHILNWARARLKIFRTHWRIAEKTNRDVKKWLKKSGHNRFFIWIHYFDAHSYEGKSDPNRDPRPAYEAKVRYVDEQVGRVRSWVEMYSADETLYLFVSDHGESLAEAAYEGRSGHGCSLSDREIVVPLVMGPLPEVAGITVTEQVRTIDIAPTILSTLGLPEPAGWQGVSLWPQIRGEQSEELVAFAMADPKRNDARCIRTERWKLIQTREALSLYDLQTDPGETEDLSAAKMEVVSELSKQLSDWGRGRSEDYDVEEDELIRDMLRGLGYLEETREGYADMSPQKTSPLQRLLQGTVVFGSRNVLLVGIDFFSALLLIRLLSTADYARLTLALSARSVAAVFLNLGLGPFIASEVARSLGQERLDQVKRYLLRYGQMVLLTGLSFLLIALVAQWPLRHLFSPLVAWVVLIVGIELFVTAWRCIFRTTFYGYARFKSMGGIDVLESVFRLGLIVLLLALLGRGLRGAILVYPVSTALALLLVLPRWLRIIWSLRRIAASRAPVFRQGLKGPGKWTILARPFKQIRDELPLWLIQMMLGKSGVALFAVARKGYGYTALLLRALQDVLLPLISESVDADRRVTRQLIHSSSKYALLGAVLLIVTGMIFSPLVYDAIFEYPTAASTYRLLLFSLLPRALTLYQRPMLFGLRGQRYLVLTTALSLLWLAAGVGLGVMWLGVAGAAIGVFVNVCLTAVLRQWAIRRLRSNFYMAWQNFFRVDEFDRKLFFRLCDGLISRV